MTTRKRLKVALLGFGLNFITVWVGMYYSVDLVALGTCLALVNAPLYAYITGDTIRPTKNDKE